MSKTLLERIDAYKKAAFLENNTVLVCKITGVTFDNRQDAIRSMDNDTELRLVRQPENKFDSNAILVEALVDDIWMDIGYIPKEINKDVANKLDTGVFYKVKIINITELPNSGVFGVRISLNR